MEIATKKFSCFLISLGLVAFITVSFFSISMGMEMRGDGTMSGCLFDRKAEICSMNLVEHLSRWRGMFTAICAKANLLIQFLLLAFAFVIFAFALGPHLPLLFNHHSSRWRLYIKQNPQLLLFDYLREAFSQGILNPKIY